MGGFGTCDNSKTVYESEKITPLSDKKPGFLSESGAIFYFFYAFVEIFFPQYKFIYRIYNWIQVYYRR